MIFVPIGPAIILLVLALILLVGGVRRKKSDQLSLGAILLGLAVVTFGYSNFAMETMQDVPPFYHGTLIDEVLLAITIGAGVALAILGIAGYWLSRPFWELLFRGAH